MASRKRKFSMEEWIDEDRKKDIEYWPSGLIRKTKMPGLLPSWCLRDDSPLNRVKFVGSPELLRGTAFIYDDSDGKERLFPKASVKGSFWSLDPLKCRDALYDFFVNDKRCSLKATWTEDGKIALDQPWKLEHDALVRIRLGDAECWADNLELSSNGNIVEGFFRFNPSPVSTYEVEGFSGQVEIEGDVEHLTVRLVSGEFSMNDLSTSHELSIEEGTITISSKDDTTAKWIINGFPIFKSSIVEQYVDNKLVFRGTLGDEFTDFRHVGLLFRSDGTKYLEASFDEYGMKVSKIYDKNGSLAAEGDILMKQWKDEIQLLDDEGTFSIILPDGRRVEFFGWKEYIADATPHAMEREIKPGDEDYITFTKFKRGQLVWCLNDLGDKYISTKTLIKLLASKQRHPLTREAIIRPIPCRLI